ncbi:hypothetical protein KBY55_28950 [Streptomyces sp. b94]|uniref:hypothetical protein n=1 Tax=Streptomyces sp. b94 TaxID=1827634 RepID=UPI001B35D25A|nr:hypothetical protein [Streptomyces sp. b94]MBQ1099977.1 hypothetical protein [Streptomyces sp. b94]
MVVEEHPGDLAVRPPKNCTPWKTTMVGQRAANEGAGIGMVQVLGRIKPKAEAVTGSLRRAVERIVVVHGRDLAENARGRARLPSGSDSSSCIADASRRRAEGVERCDSLSRAAQRGPPAVFFVPHLAQIALAGQASGHLVDRGAVQGRAVDEGALVDARFRVCQTIFRS